MNDMLATVFGYGRDMLEKIKPARGNGKRVLINEILSLQLVITAIIGTLAIAGLYWGGQWVLQDNYSRWALQWTNELNELGSPLYLADDSEALLRLESFVNKYPEIGRVSYFREDGQLLSGSYMDYVMPRADDLPAFEFHSHPVPATTNPLGAKGCGEAGCTGALPAIMNAINDALVPFGARVTEHPMTPELILKALGRVE